MPWRDVDDGDDDSWRIDEDEDDAWDDDEAEFVECRYCGKNIVEDQVRCPHCGKYQSAEDSPGPTKPWWIWVGVIVCLYVIYRWIAH